MIIKSINQLGEETSEEQNDTAYINKTQKEMEQQEKYNNIDRKFTFNISEQAKNKLNEELNLLYKDMLVKKDNVKDYNVKEVLYSIRENLYYYIGIEDYCMAFENANSITYLCNRAKYSAMLQILEAQMQKQGWDIKNDLKIDTNVQEYLPGLPESTKPYFDNTITQDRITVKVNNDQQLMIPSIVYHGTSANVQQSDIGKKDTSGKYYIRDGALYWAFEKNSAKSYGNNILEHKLGENDKFICIDDTNGGIAFRCHEELYKQSKAGTKYVLCSNPHRSHIMDISNYADFVDTRDEKLVEKLRGLGELAKPFYDKNVSYSEYMEELEKAREQESR